MVSEGSLQRDSLLVEPPPSYGGGVWNNKMPVKYGKDKKGRFARWGRRGKKYYYSNKASRTRAVNKAKRQGRAIHGSR